MERLPLPLIALLALLFAAPLHAQNDAPDDTPDIDPLIGTWEGIEMDGEAMPEGEMHITFNADGSGTFTERGGDADDFTYTHNPEGKAICTIYMEEEDSFSFEVEFDGNTATFTPTDDDGPPPLVIQRVVDEDAGDAMPRPAELADMSDSPLVGRWALVSFNGEALPEDVNLEFENSADGTGASFENGEPSDTYTWQHDFETGIVTFVHGEGEEPAAFTFVIENGVATYISTDETMTIVERRIDSEDAIDEMADEEDVELDTIIGTWYVQRTHDGWVSTDSELRFEFREDATVHFFEDGDEQGDSVVFYGVNETDRTLQFFPQDLTGVDISGEYAFVDDVLLLAFRVNEGEEQEMVLARNPEGNEEHRHARIETRSNNLSHTESAVNLKAIHQALVTIAWSQREVFPNGLGVLLTGDSISAEHLLVPWANIDIPENLDEWSDAQKTQWALDNTSYGFALAGQMDNNDPAQVLLFELPLFEETESIGICFGDGHVERFPYDEADALIEEQTGKDLMQWMEDMGREQIEFIEENENQEEPSDE